MAADLEFQAFSPVASGNPRMSRKGTDASLDKSQFQPSYLNGEPCLPPTDVRKVRIIEGLCHVAKTNSARSKGRRPGADRRRSGGTSHLCGAVGGSGSADGCAVARAGCG